MTLQELRLEIRDLGFEDDNIFTEYRTIINHAITRACKVIATTVKAPTDKITLDLADDTVRNEDGRYDLLEMTKSTDGNYMFDSIEYIVDNVPTGIEAFLNYDTEEGHILVLNPTLRNKLTIFYKQRIIPITDSTQDHYVIQATYPCEPLVALLAAHYVWLDDDERKAILYWNEYDSLKREILEKINKITAKVIGGFSWLK